MTETIVVEKEQIDAVVGALEQRVSEVKSTLATPATATDPRFREQAALLTQQAQEAGDKILTKARQAQEYARAATETTEASSQKVDTVGESKVAPSANLSALVEGVGKFLEAFLDEDTFKEFAKGVTGLLDTLEGVFGKERVAGVRSLWNTFEKQVPVHRENIEQLRKAGEQFREVTRSLEKSVKDSGLDKSLSQIAQTLKTSTGAGLTPGVPSDTSTEKSSGLSAEKSSTSTSNSTGLSAEKSSVTAGSSTNIPSDTPVEKPSVSTNNSTEKPTVSTSNSSGTLTEKSTSNSSDTSTEKPSTSSTGLSSSAPAPAPSTPSFVEKSAPVVSTYTPSPSATAAPVMFESAPSSSSSGGGYTISRDDLKDVIRNAILLSEQGGSETQLTSGAAQPGMLSTEGYGQIGTVVGTATPQGTLDTSQVTYEKPASTPLSKDQMLAIIGQALDIHGIQDPAARSKWAGTLMYIAQNESSFNPAAGNGWDSNARGAMKSDGFPAQSSRGLFQFIPASFASSHMAGTSTSIYDPLAGAAACVKYLQTRYGIRPDGAGLDEFYSARYPTYHGY